MRTAAARNGAAGRGARAQVPQDDATQSGPALWLQLTTFVLALAGLGVSIYLTIAHFTESTLAGCSESGLVNCTKVTTSPQSYVFGIPVAVLGLAFYLFAAAIMSPWAWQAARREIHLLRMASVVVAIGFVLYLIYAELFIIGSICLYCTSVHAITFVLFVLTMIAAAAWGLKPGVAWKSGRAGSVARRPPPRHGGGTLGSPGCQRSSRYAASPAGPASGAGTAAGWPTPPGTRPPSRTRSCQLTRNGRRYVVTVQGMADYPEGRMLAIIGSGETSPTMVTVHRTLVSRLGLNRPQAIVLATSLRVPGECRRRLGARAALLRGQRRPAGAHRGGHQPARGSRDGAAAYRRRRAGRRRAGG